MALKKEKHAFQTMRARPVGQKLDERCCSFLRKEAFSLVQNKKKHATKLHEVSCTRNSSDTFGTPSEFID